MVTVFSQLLILLTLGSSIQWARAQDDTAPRDESACCQFYRVNSEKYQKCCEKEGTCGDTCLLKSSDKEDPFACCVFYENNMDMFQKCCEERDTCSFFCPIKFPHGQGCLVNGKWYPVGAVVDTNVDKCFYEKCCVNPACPYPHVDVVHVDNCCEHEGVLYESGAVVHLGECRSRECINGSWVESEQDPPELAPCPASTFQYGEFCLSLLSVWLPWSDAVGLCDCADGWNKWWEDGESLKAAIRRIAGCAEGVWLTGEEPVYFGDVPACIGLPIGVNKPFSVQCSTRLRPLCALKRVPCDASQCTVDKKKYENGEIIKEVDQCTNVTCVNGYPTVSFDQTCCNVELDGQIHQMLSGTVFEYGEDKCVCVDGMAKCCVDCVIPPQEKTA